MEPRGVTKTPELALAALLLTGSFPPTAQEAEDSPSFHGMLEGGSLRGPANPEPTLVPRPGVLADLRPPEAGSWTGREELAGQTSPGEDGEAAAGAPLSLLPSGLQRPSAQ